jgi:hypothetical protein
LDLKIEIAIGWMNYTRWKVTHDDGKYMAHSETLFQHHAQQNAPLHRSHTFRHAHWHNITKENTLISMYEAINCRSHHQLIQKKIKNQLYKLIKGKMHKQPL